MDECQDKILMILMIFVETRNIPHSTKYFDYASKATAITLAVEILKGFIYLVVTIITHTTMR